MSTNLLGAETSPYLLQHRDNPVHWHPWGAAAFARARAEDKPILLSIGYAACHWCHVMAHESFEDIETARLMNEHFINIKVDREERPDVDKIYMDALHALGEHGGWPLTMFLDPQGTPFWGGTYFPAESRYGRPGFRHVLTEIARIWRHERHKVDSNRTALREALSPPPPGAGADLTPGILAEAARQLLSAIDPEHGGLRGAPKFPQCSIFELLRRHGVAAGDGAAHWALDLTLRHICQGGIYDHLGGGFSRYSVDARWLVPHFEKMLYDNAQLVGLLARHWVKDRDNLFRLRIEETVAWTLREMRTREGAFAASYDADSEGEEGKFYVWSADEIDRVLPDRLRIPFKTVYDISTPGNFEGHNIPNRLGHLDLLDAASEADLGAARALLFQHRRSRIHPAWDDKVLADWNGLMIAALAEAGMLLDRPDWIAAAAAAFDAVMGLLWKDDCLHHAWRAGKLRHRATADGHANLIAAAIHLHEATADARWIAAAEKLAAALDRDHWDGADGGYFFASAAADHLIVRPKFAHDDATPNANAVMLSNLARLHPLTGKPAYLDRARRLHDAFAGAVRRNLIAHASFLAGFADLTQLVQIVIVAAPGHDQAAAALQRTILAHPLPGRLVIRVGDPQSLPDGHPARNRPVPATGASLYLCCGQTCSLPLSDAGGIAAAFATLGLGSPLP